MYIDLEAHQAGATRCGICVMLFQFGDFRSSGKARQIMCHNGAGFTRP